MIISYFFCFHNTFYIYSVENYCKDELFIIKAEMQFTQGNKE